jgi:hypothetical protein
VVNRLLEIYKFGPTAEIMEAMDNVPPQTQQMPFTPEQQEAMKVASLEVFKDTEEARKSEFLEVIRDVQKAKEEA